jgi:hypothetical protein
VNVDEDRCLKLCGSTLYWQRSHDRSMINRLWLKQANGLVSIYIVLYSVGRIDYPFINFSFENSSRLSGIDVEKMGVVESIVFKPFSLAPYDEGIGMIAGEIELEVGGENINLFYDEDAGDLESWSVRP